MPIIRVRTELSGFGGAPGLMTQYFSPALADINSITSQYAVDRVRDALVAFAGSIPNSMTWRVQGQADVLDEATGQLVASYNVTERNGAGTNTSGYGPLPVGACVTWLTAAFKNGRRVYGRTFLVPLALNQFETNGTLTNACLTNVQAFADSMNNAGTLDMVFVVWSRPNASGTGGSKHGVAGSRTSDKAAVLRSRRQ